MKRIFKIIVLTIMTFWVTIIIMEAKESVEKYVFKNKKETVITETTDFISKKGKGFVDYIMMKVKILCEQINEITNIVENSNNLDNDSKKIQELKKINLGVKEIIEKKNFIGLDKFISKVKDLTLLIDDYIILVEKNINKNFDRNRFKEKQNSIENARITLEEFIKTIEVN